MKISDLKRNIGYLIKNDVKQPAVPFLKGKPGIGKSEAVYQLAEDMGISFIDLRLSQLESADIRGIPHPNPEFGSAQWLPPETIPFEAFSELSVPETYPINVGKKFKDGGILFLDELNRARHDVLQAVFQLVLDRCVGLHRLLDNWSIVVAGNLGSEDGTDVIELDAALNNRFVHFRVDAVLDDWLDWAKGADVHQDVIGFIQSHPKYLDYKTKENDEVFLSPRSWAKFSQILKNNSDVDERELAANIGPHIINGAASMFVTYLEQKEVVSPKDVLLNFKKVKTKIKAMQRDQVYQLDAEVVNFMSKDYQAFLDNEVSKITKKLKRNGVTADELKEQVNEKTNELKEKWLNNMHEYLGPDHHEEDIKIACMQQLTKACGAAGVTFMDEYLKMFIEDSKAIVASLTKKR